MLTARLEELRDLAAGQYSHRMKHWIFAALLVISTLPAMAQPGPRTPGMAEIGQVLPEAALDGLNGPRRKLSDYRGRPLVINVWASWCGPCRAEMASLERLAWSDLGQRFTIIGVSTDDYRDKAAGWLQRSNATINHYIDHDLLLEHLLGASQLPLTVLVDARGRVVDRVYGAREWDKAETTALIRRAFALPRP